MESIVGKFVKELAEQLVPRDVTIEATEAGTKYLAKKGYEPEYGARPLARVMQEEVKRPLSDELLFGKLENGGHCVIDSDGEKVVFRFEGKKSGAEGS
jgi:ATP-dependent Clp protease ATP-binding subunit ClpA